MDIPVEQINQLFEPYDPQHLLLLWTVMTVFLLMVAIIVSASGIYPTRRNFWQVELLVLAGAYLLSAAGFLLFHVNAIFTIMAAVCIAFVMLGDVGHKEKNPSADEYSAMLSSNNPLHSDPEP
ncbi:MAG TPA: hypothetical protein VFA09_03415 [Ktedonobacteraceae bacterium]|nr:hypothetical protein [Ktedonobacteraceae bacterium]